MSSNEKDRALQKLEEGLKKQERTTLSFDQYLDLVCEDPGRVLRNIFQLFHDMVFSFVRQEEDNNPDDPESIGFVRYDCSKLFEEGTDNPFFADTPFANRFMRQIATLRQGFQQNRVYAYIGPTGCGKSTFLNNLLAAFERYTRSPEGKTFELLWDIDPSALTSDEESRGNTKNLTFSCPSHDYPIMIIPKAYRREFLEEVLAVGRGGKEARNHIFSGKDYEWLSRGEACTTCKSIFNALFEKLGSLDKVLQMVHAQPYRFDRRVGEGISIFNPGDRSLWGVPNGPVAAGYLTNDKIQEQLDEIFGIGGVRYVYSPLAKTNHGIYVLMDVKGHNQERLVDLHNVVSEGVHKVDTVEEGVQSLFFALMNPEDKSLVEKEGMESFRGRIKYDEVSYVLEPHTEANIYRSIFGSTVDAYFQPRILENFARAIVSSRMAPQCEPLSKWIPDLSKYKLYCDISGMLLRMELYSSDIPPWLSEEDRSSFKADVRRAVIGFGSEEGDKGWSGRDSIALFSEFFGKYSRRKDRLINMDDVIEFFKRGIDKPQRDTKLPAKGFLESLLNSYNYSVLNEVQEALYFYNEEQIRRDLLHYLCAVNYEIGQTISCKYTGEEVRVTEAFLVRLAERLTGEKLTTEQALEFAERVQRRSTAVMAQGLRGGDITDSDLYKELFGAYARDLKRNALKPFVSNDTFSEAIRAFGTPAFAAYEARIKEHISHMITNLQEQKLGYSEQGAKEICLYVLEHDLVKTFSDEITAEEA